ncbi:MAG: ABC transporter ATP-binding protein [Candidatus Yanofskyibacterium parasiticum]|nr:MAG: ABC transporter ATP-binding protein [Candidatus Yanofskybacteria bacterium]
MEIEIKNLACGYHTGIIAENINLRIESGQILCLLGPNGAGKTTLLKTILGFIKPKQGNVLINGKNIDCLSAKKISRSIAYVPQIHTPPFPFSVLDVVTMGRNVHLGMFDLPSKKDYSLAEETLASLGISFLKDRIYTEISGGERQMVLLARALAQQPEILAMDEPTLNLDFGNQTRVLNQIRRLARRGIGIIMISHFPDHAFLLSGKAALMQKNGPFVFGNTEEVITEENLKSAYGINVRIADVDTGAGVRIKTCVPIAS